LRFDTPRSARVWLDIVGVNGRRVRSLLAGQYVPAGSVERTWDGRDDRGNGVAAGVYLVHLRADDFTATRKVQLIK
jgi:flagellar hook assembly protein FlgD